MADVITTSSINSLVNTYTQNEVAKLVKPLETKKDNYTSQATSYDTLIAKLNPFKTDLTTFNQTGADNIFSYKLAASSDTKFITASSSSTALSGSYEMRVNALAKKDIAISGSVVSTDTNALTGKHLFKIITGDGEGGDFTSNVEVDFNGTETNKTAIEKIQDAINGDKAIVKSDSKVGTDAYIGGVSTFKIDLNGTEKTITFDGTAPTYSALMDSLASSINNDTDGITAEKIVDPLDSSKFKLSLLVDESSKYITITHDTGFNLVNDLNIGVTKVKGASGIVTASSFSPVPGSSQLNITAKESGLDFRIKNISDDATYSALNTFNLNLGTTRPAFNQGTNTPGFLYTDITAGGNQLNSKITFNGLELQRNSNTITDLAAGLTINLKSVMDVSDLNTTVSVESDISSIKEKINSFITKFNETYTYLKTNTAYNPKDRGKLYGDSNAQTLLGYLSAAAYTTTPDTKVNALSSLGITFNTATGLTLSDASKLQSKINASPEKVAALFNGTEGITTKLLSSVDPYLRSTGYLNTQKTSLTKNAKLMATRVTTLQARIDKSAETLRSRYINLQMQMSSLMQVQNLFN